MPPQKLQIQLGHNSKAIHRAYARKAKVKLPSLEAYEKRAGETQIIPLPLQQGMAADREPVALHA